MSFLLDTNVVSEWTKPRPNAGLVGWLAQVDEDEVFLSVVSNSAIVSSSIPAAPRFALTRFHDS